MFLNSSTSEGKCYAELLEVHEPFSFHSVMRSVVVRRRASHSWMCLAGAREPERTAGVRSVRTLLDRHGR